LRGVCSTPGTDLAARKALILVAPPRALGVIRQVHAPHLRAALRAEIDKDFVKLPVHEIEKHLADER
jgi:protein required for attachment to host cells